MTSQNRLFNFTRSYVDIVCRRWLCIFHFRFQQVEPIRSANDCPIGPVCQPYPGRQRQLVQRRYSQFRRFPCLEGRRGFVQEVAYRLGSEDIRSLFGKNRCGHLELPSSDRHGLVEKLFNRNFCITVSDTYTLISMSYFGPIYFCAIWSLWCLVYITTTLNRTSSKYDIGHQRPNNIIYLFCFINTNLTYYKYKHHYDWLFLVCHAYPSRISVTIHIGATMLCRRPLH